MPDAVGWRRAVVVFVIAVLMSSRCRFVGSPSRQSVELFQEAHGGFAISLDPFGMLDPQIVVNLLPKLGVGPNEFHKRLCIWNRSFAFYLLTAHPQGAHAISCQMRSRNCHWRGRSRLERFCGQTNLAN